MKVFKPFYVLSLLGQIAATVSASSNSDTKFLTIVFRFDSYSYETGFSVKAVSHDGTPDHTIASVFPGSYYEPAGTRVEEVVYLWPLVDDFHVQEYKVSIFDEYGDGIFNPGFYEIWYGPANDAEGTLIEKGGDFYYQDATFFSNPYVHFLGPNPEFPLGRCEGDCDNDSQCRDNLICYQRGPYDDIPGCGGGLEDTSRTDYCTFPILKIIDSNPSSPIRLCEGDCDDDNDCEGNFVCFQRNGGEPVPGCFGGSSDGSRTDYCIDPNAIVPPIEIKIIGPNPSSPIEVCEGDCDTDDDCLGGLICFHREGGEEVPGCIGGSSDGSRTDYCIVDDTARM